MNDESATLYGSNVGKEIRVYFDTSCVEVESDIEVLNIFEILSRPTKNLYVHNEGKDKMFVKIYTSDNLSNFYASYASKECWIYPKSMRQFKDVYKIIISKVPIGNLYRVTEFKDYGIIPRVVKW